MGDSKNQKEEAMNVQASQQKVILPSGYRPSDNEEYMNPMHIEYFRQKLVEWKNALQAESMQTVEHLKEDNPNEPDLNDRASTEAEIGLELRTRDRYRKLMDKIDAALLRIERGSYGYCDETGDPIGIRRLEARPIATLSIEAQEKHERFEKSHSEEDE
jgi:DnaK suppressor protein